MTLWPKRYQDQALRSMHLRKRYTYFSDFRNRPFFGQPPTRMTRLGALWLAQRVWEAAHHHKCTVHRKISQPDTHLPPCVSALLWGILLSRQHRITCTAKYTCLSTEAHVGGIRQMIFLVQILEWPITYSTVHLQKVQEVQTSLRPVAQCLVMIAGHVWTLI